MLLSDFIGRGENLTSEIISRLFEHTRTRTQVPILKVINPEDYAQYGEEFSKHKCDIVMDVVDSEFKAKTLVIEVNYKHKEKAAKKWRKTFAPDISAKMGHHPVTIDDHDCRSSIPGQKGLFYLDSKKKHGPITWNDFRDIIDQLEKSGISP